MSAELYAQQVEVTHDPVPSLPTGRELIPDTISQVKNIATDSLRIPEELSRIQQVYSEKQWKSFSDSLHKIPFVNIPELPDAPVKKEVSEEELIQAVNKEFFSGAEDSVSGKLAKADSLQGLTDMDRYTMPSSDLLNSKADLSQLTLAQYSRADLPPISGNFVKSIYIKELDSIRKINLKEERLKLEEKKLSEQAKLSTFQKKPSFLDRSYFEGVIGVSGGDFTILQASPALGYHFTDYLSLGLGPNIIIREEDRKINSTVGIRSFVKTEFMKRQAYVQVEDIMDSYAGDPAAEKKPLFEQHNIFVGAGYLLSISSPLTLNLAVLYRVSDNKFITNEFSPWVFRIGISSIKIKK